MKSRPNPDTWLALTVLAFALVLIFVWIPLDTGTGLVEKVRRKFVIGDALAPVVAGAIIALGALLTLLESTTANQTPKGLDKQNLRWLLTLLIIFTVSLTIMRYAGPLAALGTESGYRALRATPPWHYLGFVFGGTVLIAGLRYTVTRRVSLRDIIIGFLATLAIALMYDLPFDDLLLPPNGDV